MSQSSQNPTADVLGLAHEAFGGLYPVILAVARAAVVLLVVWFGARSALTTLRNGGYGDDGYVLYFSPRTGELRSDEARKTLETKGHDDFAPIRAELDGMSDEQVNTETRALKGVMADYNRIHREYTAVVGGEGSTHDERVRVWEGNRVMADNVMTYEALRDYRKERGIDK